MSDPTLYDWAGGRDAIGRLINAFYDRVDRDDLLSGFFPGGVSEHHREYVTDWWSEVFGGPATYTEQHGGYENMVAHHIDLGITPEHRLRFATLMTQAADDAALPDDPEFRAALVGYLEWGTRIAMLNSQPGADVVPHAPVPRWGWGVAPPYQPSLHPTRSSARAPAESLPVDLSDVVARGRARAVLDDRPEADLMGDDGSGIPI